MQVMYILVIFQNVVAWTNLGALYLKKGNIEVMWFCQVISLTLLVLESHADFYIIFLALSWSFQDCSVARAPLCELLDRTGTLQIDLEFISLVHYYMQHI